ncbi:MAG: peptide chain release factor 1 [Bdellovibrionales bacterium]|nr:peptide chain release factor 1 [Bdellovibrionales bacterium]
MYEQLEDVVAAYRDIETRLSQPETVGNQKLFQKLSKNHSRLQPLVHAYEEWKGLCKQRDENVEMMRTEAGELAEMAKADNEDLEPRIEQLSHDIRILLLPRDPNDDKNILLEIRPAAGGDESGIFAGDLYRMYSKYAEENGWRIEPMSIVHNDVGGFKEIMVMIRGERVYSRLKYESGVHRVQRVPKTETQGRVHTSTVTVAVLPEAEDVEVQIDPGELRIDVFRSSGPGGQSVNTTDSAVRVTHIPSGLVVVCQDEKSQHKNKAKALKVLKTRLLDIKEREQHDKISAERASQIGTGGRSEKIRTYNFPQGRVTDHRIGVTLYQLDAFLTGDIAEMISKLNTHYESEALKANTFESALSGISEALGE